MKIITLEDSILWDQIVTSFPNFDIYYLSGYVKSFQLHGDGEPVLFYLKSETFRAIYVAMKRDIANVTWIKDEIPKGTYFDLVTPYGYGGILFDGEINDENLDLFDEIFTKQLKSENIVADFVRYHPVLKNADSCRNYSQVIDLGKTICMDLESSELIWTNITSKNRNTIRKAVKNEVTIHHSTDVALFDDFIRIYNATMDKDNASDYYYFSKEFYKSIYTDLLGNYEMFYALYDNKIIAMSIMIFANDQMSYHLSGSLLEYRNMAPTNLLLYKAACWGAEQGFKTFHLGGGVGSGEDNLYKFKEGFNRNSNVYFSVGKRIVNSERYNQLVNLRESVDATFDKNASFFPLYRA